ncbi:MAG: solute-binding protein [Firmicutes bacterium]|nr:solute-binding protein [Bacillota bacterium]
MRRVNSKILVALFAALFLTVLVLPSLAAERLILATTTSTVNSGLLDYLLPDFEKKYNIQVHVISVGTGQAIKIAEQGDCDVVLVHARDLEDKFVADGYGVNRRDVMYNDFIILGPVDDPAGVRTANKATGAFKRIANAQAPFISRGDNSGTHVKELDIWNAAGIEPKGAWYRAVGQGMGACLNIANEVRGYVLSDRATYLSGNYPQLDIVFEGDEILFNPYGIIAVNPAVHKHVNYDGAMKLINWIMSPEAQAKIKSFGVNGKQLFFLYE